MSLITIEVAIDHGRIVPREPGKLPEQGHGLLTILAGSSIGEEPKRERVQFPLIPGQVGEVVNPTREDLDDSLWD